MQPDPTFSTEAELCAAAIEALPEGWTAYNETAGFDMVWVHDAGFQIAVEAKLVLNPKVLLQVLQGRRRMSPGPDFRAVLVGRVIAETALLARALGITVLTLQADWQGPRRRNAEGPPRRIYHIRNGLPCVQEIKYPTNRHSWLDSEEWFDEAPEERLELPEYVPDVAAGVPAPTVMGDWKIKAMKVCIWLQRNHRITRAQFKAMKINSSRWMNGYWLRKSATRGVWEPGPKFPAEVFQRQHPMIWSQIEADYETWAESIPPAPPAQGALL